MLKATTLKWAFNGLVFGVLASATLNALSYFVRSGGWQNLVKLKGTPQAIGFPFEIWRYGMTYDGAMIDQRAMTWNVGFAMLAGSFLAVVFVRQARWLDRFVESMIEDEKKHLTDAKMQFSLKGLLLMTGIAAVVAALARAAIGARPELLVAIYLFGPLFLIVLAMFPSGLTWQYRIVLLTPATLLMIGFAIFVGQRLGLQFDQVMMGIFICWVPQTVIAAACLTLGLAIRYNLRVDHDMTRVE